MKNQPTRGAAKAEVCAVCKNPILGDEWQVEFQASRKLNRICNSCARPIMEFLSKHHLLAD